MTDTVVHSYRARVAEDPTRRAVGELTYGEFDAIASARAGSLTDLPIGTVVAVALDDPAEQASWLVAVAIAGLAAVSLDVGQPAARRAELLARSGAARVITDPQHADIVIAPRGLPRTEGTTPAYVCFTSGSTGVPKGVVVSHAAIAATVRVFAAHLGNGPRDHVLATSWAFDVAMLDLWLALTTGGRLVLPVRDRLLTGLPDLLAGLDRPVLQTVPSLLRGLTDTDISRLPPDTTVVLGGESTPESLLTRLTSAVDLRVAYGVTEVTVCSTAGLVRPGAEHTGIGSPLPGVRHAVLDQDGNAATEGELWLGGPGVALGYLADPVATAQAFRPDPGGAPGARRYRTGDLVRQETDGTLTFLGRVDDQLSVRGHRIEPAEVERALGAVPGVRQAAVAARPDRSGSPCLVGFVVGEVDLAAARTVLADRLPGWLVPDRLIALAELPLNANGKVVRADLPAPGWGPSLAAEVAATDVDGTVERLWHELLGDDGEQPSPAAAGDFVGLGGHSLKAVQLSTALRDRLGVSVPVSAVLGAASVTDLAGLVRTAGPIRPDRAASSEPERVGLTALQRQMWLYQELAGDIGLYNLVVSMAIGGPLDVLALERALHDIERHHGALRRAYRFDGDDVTTREVPADPPRLRVRRSHGRDQAVIEAGAKALDLTAGRLWDYQLLRASEGHVLLLTFHHIAVDGASVVALLAELAARYREHTGAGSVRRPPAHDENRALDTVDEDLQVWRRLLVDPPAPIRLPGQAVAKTTGNLTGFVTPVELVGVDPGRLRRLAGRRGGTLQSAVLSCVVRALTVLTGERDVLLGISVSRRGADAPVDAIGQYGSGLPMRFDLPVDGAVACLDAVTSRMRQVLDHPRVDPGAVLEVLRAQGVDPVFQISFGWDEDSPPLDLPGLAVEWRLEFNGWAEWGLAVELAARSDRITGRLCGRADVLAGVDLPAFMTTVTACAVELMSELTGDGR
jgi:amino acid adenylation domain-containing protein